MCYTAFFYFFLQIVSWEPDKQFSKLNTLEPRAKLQFYTVANFWIKSYFQNNRKKIIYSLLWKMSKDKIVTKKKEKSVKNLGKKNWKKIEQKIEKN